MRPSVLSLLFVTFIHFVCLAQIPAGNMQWAKGINNTYVFSRAPKSSVVSVRNERNSLGDTQPAFPKSLDHLVDPWVIKYRTTRLDNAKLLSNIAGVFSAGQLEELKNERLILRLYFSDSGDLLEVSFALWPASRITIKEINAIENQLRKNLKLAILTDDMKGSTFLQYNKTVYFRDLKGIIHNQTGNRR